MKKILCLILITVLVAGCCFALTSCNKPEPQIDETAYFYTAFLVLSTCLSGYNGLISNLNSVGVTDEYGIAASFLKDDGLDEIRIVIDKKNGNIVNVYLKSGDDVKSVLRKSNDYVFNEANASAQRALIESAENDIDSFFVQIGYKKEENYIKFLTEHYPQYSKSGLHLYFAPMKFNIGEYCLGLFLHPSSYPRHLMPGMGALGMNEERFGNYRLDPQSGNVKENLAPALWFEDVAARFYIDSSYPDAYKQFAKDLMYHLSGDENYAYYYSMARALHPDYYIKGFDCVAEKSEILSLLDNDDNLFIINSAPNIVLA